MQDYTSFSGDHYEVLVQANKKDHKMSQLISVSSFSNLFAENRPIIGSCVAKEIDLEFFPQEPLPRMAEINVFVRPASDSGVPILTNHVVQGMYNIPALGLVAGDTYIVTLAGVSYTCTAIAVPNDPYTFVGLQSDAFQLLEYPKELQEMSGITVEFKLIKNPGVDPDVISIGHVVEADWLPKGTYYIDTREEDWVTGVMKIHGYDAVLKAEAKFLTEEDTGTWPRTTHQVVASIASRLGVSVDTRFAMNAYKVSYPGDLTMREMLGHIAVAHGGNWVITDDNKLRLVPLKGNADQVDIGNKAASLDVAPKLAAYTGVRVYYDDESAFFAGTEDNVLEVECPWATQAIANNILSAVSGYEYQPFNAETALLDPAAELGDIVTVGGVTAHLCSIATTFDTLCASDIGAPNEQEIDHEFPFMTKQERTLKRIVSLGLSYYGTIITRANGLEIIKTAADGSEKSRATLNSDILAFYNDDGEEALYFDASVGRYRFRGDVEITGGTMNINNNFVVDEDGNLTLKGNINLSEGSITWGQNYPGGGGLSEDEVEEIASTVITSELVSAPTIMGAKVYGGAYYDSYGGGRLELSYASYPLLDFSGDVDGVYKSGFTVGILPDDGYVGITVGNGVAWESNVDSYWSDGGGSYADVIATGVHTFIHRVVFTGTVDFSNATVIGL